MDAGVRGGARWSMGGARCCWGGGGPRGRNPIATRRTSDVSGRAGKAGKREIGELEWAVEDAEQGGYAHFMLKEIFEQPRALQESLLPTLAESIVNGLDLNWRIGSISIVACGTSFHAGLVGKYVIEQLTAIPVNVYHASEFRYSPPVQNVGGMLSARPLVLLKIGRASCRERV